MFQFKIVIRNTTRAHQRYLLSKIFFGKFFNRNDYFSKNLIFILRISGYWESRVGDFCSYIFEQYFEHVYGGILRMNLFGSKLGSMDIDPSGNCIE